MGRLQANRVTKANWTNQSEAVQSRVRLYSKEQTKKAVELQSVSRQWSYTGQKGTKWYKTTALEYKCLGRTFT